MTGNHRHGGFGTNLHHVWANMLGRCRNPKDAAFPAYGGRGVSVCPEWEDFVVFRDWAEAHGYAGGLWLDRVDNSGNYEPGNCRWATPAEQAQNRRNTKLTPELVRAIRADKRSSNAAEKDYPVSARTIRKVRKGDRWANIHP